MRRVNPNPIYSLIRDFFIFFFFFFYNHNLFLYF